MEKEVLDYWFGNENVWFDSTSLDDIFITATFYKYMFDFEVTLDLFEKSNEKILATVIFNDQLKRHFKRVNKNDIIDNSLLVSLIRKLDYTFFCSFEPKENIFLLLPLRHTFNKSDTQFCKNIIEKLINYHGLNNYYKKFLFHTIKQLSTFNNITLQCFNKYIPEFFLKQYLVTNNNNNHLYNFDSSKLKETNIYKSVVNFVKENNFKNILVSLSGGVDSLLLLGCLHTLKTTLNTFNLEAIHINYNNSFFKSKLEKEFCIRWCEYHSIKLHIRDINEIYRTDSSIRDIYEDVTKYIRFNSYSQTFIKDVFLGHNKTDCIENIFTNIKKGTKYEDLFGMKKSCEVNKIFIHRPFLNFLKKDIIKTSQLISLNHTQNSTPKWSDRGKIRKFVEDNNYEEGLINIRNLISETYIEIEKIVQSIKIEKNSEFIIIDNYIGVYSLEVWKKIFNSLSLNYSQKSIKNFVLNKNKIKRFSIGKEIIDINEEYVRINFG